MLRLSKLADYAVVVLVRLSHGDDCQTSPCIAAKTGLPEPTVAKVLKALAASSLVTSQRGARGGYRLAQSLSGISVADVVTAIDGPIALTACTEGGADNCGSESSCPVRGRWDPVNQALLEALTRITLADMTAAAPRPAALRPRPAVAIPVSLPAE
jgi:FeS assembly SUF system regulator